MRGREGGGERGRKEGEREGGRENTHQGQSPTHGLVSGGGTVWSVLYSEHRATAEQYEHSPPMQQVSKTSANERQVIRWTCISINPLSIHYPIHHQPYLFIINFIHLSVIPPPIRYYRANFSGANVFTNLRFMGKLQN